MKCLKPPFSAMNRIPGDVLHLPRTTGLAVEIGELHAVGSDDGHVAVGQERKCRACGRECAGTSEATKYSSLPKPMTAGGPLRAATILLGSSVEITASANTPVSCFTV